MADESQKADGLKEVPASEILAKIKNGEPAEYDSVVIMGDLDVRELNLPNDNHNGAVRSLLKLRNSIIKGHINFKNIQFKGDVDLVLSQVEGWVDFSLAEFKKPAYFDGFKAPYGIDFSKAIFHDSVSFVNSEFSLEQLPTEIELVGAEFRASSYFMGTKFHGNANFRDAKFKDKADFRQARFCIGANFIRANFGDDANFIGSMFTGDTFFVLSPFEELVHFMNARFEGEVLTFKDAKFSSPIDQEDACRRAKNVMERSGNRERAGYHFYREMEAKRKYNGILSKIHRPIEISSWQNWQKFIRLIKYDFFEYVIIQGVFSYGVYPYRVIGTWFAIVLFLGIIYLIGNGVEKNDATLSWLEYFYFSIVTAATPGYGGYTPKPGFFTLLAGSEAIFGTFMWAAFIATFARKYMR